MVTPCPALVTNPVTSTVATNGALLAHVPPVDISVNAVVVIPPPKQIVFVPVIVIGILFTVTVVF